MSQFFDAVMVKFRLHTTDGHFVTEVPAPPFQVLPAVLIWGDRFFLHGHVVNPSVHNALSPDFFETFGYVVPVG